MKIYLNLLIKTAEVMRKMTTAVNIPIKIILM